LPNSFELASKQTTDPPRCSIDSGEKIGIALLDRHTAGRQKLGSNSAPSLHWSVYSYLHGHRSESVPKAAECKP
jgi:hypothetical protein